MDTKQRTIILDTHALIHRLFHALPVLSNKAGQPTNAVYGVTNILLKILHEYDPKHIFACFDRPETTERKKIYDAYKATRAPVSDDLKSQFPIVHSLMQKFNIPGEFACKDVALTAAQYLIYQQTITDVFYHGRK